MTRLLVECYPVDVIERDPMQTDYPKGPFHTKSKAWEEKNMNPIALDTDVLIVGAGPVGLFVANEGARRGLRWRLVEARAAQSEHSKALAIFPRTLEIFDM